MTLLDLMEPRSVAGQVAAIIEHCRLDWLTQMEATRLYRCTRLAARVFDAEARGYRFEREWRTSDSGARFMAYRLERS